MEIIWGGNQWQDQHHPTKFTAGGLTFTVASFLPYGSKPAFAAAEDDRIVAAAKPLGAADLRGMIWSNYYVPMQPAMQEFKKLTGIGVGSIQDISIFDAPQRAMAEALSRSPQFDFFHIDSNMIPSLASAGLLEPLDEYMKKANFKIDAVGDYANFMTYKGNTYGVITDGNVHIQYLRKDLMEDADNQKRFADKHGKKLAFPQTWEDEFQIQQFFHNPGQGPLRLRQPAQPRQRADLVVHDVLLGRRFPVRRRHESDHQQRRPATTRSRSICRRRRSAHPESAGWGTPQMIPRIASGKVVACQYWDGTARLNENKEKSPTVGKWLYGLVPGSDKSGKRIHRSISSPLAAVLVNKYSPRKAQAAYLALWWATLQELDADRVRQGQHLPRRLAQGPHDGADGGRELHAGRHEGDRAEHAGGEPADLPDRLSRVPGRARRRTCRKPMSASCRPSDVLKRTDRRVERRRQPHRPRQAQGGARELQGGDAEAGQAGA